MRRRGNNALTLAYDTGNVIYIAIASIVDRGEFPGHTTNFSRNRLVAIVCAGLAA